MSWEVATGQIWEADDENIRLEVVDETLTEPTARYELPVVIAVKPLTEPAHSVVEERRDAVVIKRDKLLQEFRLCN